jgi:hypothetical protein
LKRPNIARRKLHRAEARNTNFDERQEDTVRLVISITAALMFLSMAAFTLVSVHTMSTMPAQRMGSVLRFAPPSQAAATMSQIDSPEASAVTSATARVRLAQATIPEASDWAANAAARSSPKPVSTAIPPCDKPGGMGLTRIVEIDTTGGPGFGFEHFKQYDFLRDKEVVLTFDDGPWPNNTPAVIKR